MCNYEYDKLKCPRCKTEYDGKAYYSGITCGLNEEDGVIIAPEECPYRFTYFSNNYKDMEQPCERCVESEKSTKQWLDESREVRETRRKHWK